MLAAALHTCQAVEGDQILMRDLAIADARFSAAPAEQAAGFAPQPGAKRVFWPGELIRLAARNEIVTSAPFHQLCFELATHVIGREDIVGAIRTWAPAKATIEVLEQSRFAAPSGKLVFDRPQFMQEARDGSLLLRGYVLFRGTQRFPVWARVRIRVKKSLMVAAADLAPGASVTAEKVRAEEREMGIAQAGFASTAAEITGRVARTRISAGTPVLLTQLERPNEVASGATVNVEVRNGAARLSFEARAEASGRLGDSISVMNPMNSRIFRAKVVGKNSVLVTPAVDTRK